VPAVDFTEAFHFARVEVFGQDDLHLHQQIASRGIFELQGMEPRYAGFFRLVSLLLALPGLLSAEELRFDTPQEWQTWKLPLGALEFTATGDLRPVRLRKNRHGFAGTAAAGC